METLLTIPKKMTGGSDLIVLTKDAYDNLRQQLLETQDALGKIQRGEDEYRKGHTTPTKSVKDLDE